ncbi:Tetratricopeptide repeat-containing protein [Nakamurella panacisegetis]|uniref:Tetratricopeptide repeat-containing protein n=1 Tax=Nakamurella panacisegetis TaxID=1090615 RepID=A0A1H0NLN9_9ACTN|nr:AAA family ATPase [Nakamurella panacisegetis]SDO93589.1 Tetratricopeptide repeat-containing protein [Nakamurella panacisegetis]
MGNDPAIEAIRRALIAVPTDGPLRLHLAELLIGAGRPSEAVAELATLLAAEPDHPGARELMFTALTPDRPAVPPVVIEPEPTPPVDPGPVTPAGESAPDGPPVFDWHAAESQLGDIAAPMFLTSGDVEDQAGAEPVEAFETQRPTLTLADVGGMQQVKDRLEAAFLAPLRNPELRRLYGKNLRGGLLLYGPPGCGKTYLAKALAGELGAAFISAGLSEILDMWMGSSERNVHELFTQARQSAPCVLFLDEIDALGQKRTQTRNSSMRSVVNQLLTELDGVTSDNEGVYVLAATNQPWDVDPALRRPGRLDRTVLVLPPDGLARESIFRSNLAHRPVEGVDLRRLAAGSDGLSGADIAYVCELATERAMMHGVRSGTVRMIGMADLLDALNQVRPSTHAWLDTARTVVQYGEDDGTHAELKAFLKKSKRW